MNGEEQKVPTQEGEDRITGSFLDMDEEKQKKQDVYNTGVMNLIYSKGTKEAIYQILQSGSPDKTIPKATSLINGKMQEAIESKGSSIDLGAKVSGIVYTTMELANLGTAAGFFKLSQDDMPPIVQTSLQEYIHAGLKDGSIDPIEAQEAAESLMTEEERQKGRAIAEQKGFPSSPGMSAAMEKYAGQRVSKERQKYMQRMQKMQQSQPPPQQGAMSQAQGGEV